jgi:hypothetical protein
MDDRALMQMALDAFEAMISEGWSYCGPERTSKAQTASYEATLALRERLAQPKQEPVDYVTKYDMIRYFELIADAIEKNDSDSLRHEAWCLEQDMK